MKSASHWRIDFATLARRLLDLEMVDEAQAQEVRSVRAVKADYVELNLHVPGDMEKVSLPRAYEVAVLGLFRAETISASRARDLLLGAYDEADLPERPVKPEQAAWQVVW